MFTKKFWLQATERACKAVAYSMIGLITMDKAFNVLTVDWKVLGGAALGWALMSYLGSIASRPVSDKDSPSLV